MKYIISETQFVHLIESDIIDFDLTVNTFAEIIWKQVKKYRQVKNKNEFLAERIYWHINNAVRQFSERPPRFVSKNVADIFIYLFPGKNPFDFFYARHRQNLQNKSGLGPFMTWEHTTPVNQLVKELLEANNLSQIQNYLRFYSGASWVTIQEENCLRTSGYSLKRPEGWRQAYYSCGISPLSKNQHKFYEKEKLENYSEEEFEIIKHMYKDFFKKYRKG